MERPAQFPFSLRLLSTALCLFALVGDANAGELMQRFNALKAQGELHGPIDNPGDPAKIVAIGIERTRAFISCTPTYEVMLERDGTIAYRGAECVERLGEYRGTFGEVAKFQVLAELICASEFFDLPITDEQNFSDGPSNVFVVKTEGGEKWVFDPMSTQDKKSIMRILGERIDEILTQSNLIEEKAVRLTKDFSEIPIAAELPKFLTKLNADETVTFACLGDSVTGVYYHTGGRRAYTDMLKLALEQGFPGVEFTAINAGVSGNTTVNALERLDQDVLSYKPDLVTIMFGLNDMTRVPIEDYRANLKTLIYRCRAAGAEAVLCTPNNVEDTEGRPTAKLLEYCGVVHEVAEEMKVPMADCYNAFEAIREKDARAWSLMMSDEIHPNMDGHERIADTIASAILGVKVDPVDIPAPQPTIPHTLELIRTKQPISVLAMPPYDTILDKLLREIAPDSPLTITPWDVMGKSMAEIEESAKAIRDNPPDWVVIAAPLEAEAADFDAFKRHSTWIMNYALSFKLQEWDVIAVPPSFIAPVDVAPSRERDGWVRTLIRAQDFELIGGGGSPEAAEADLRKWLAKQLEQ